MLQLKPGACHVKNNMLPLCGDIKKVGFSHLILRFLIQECLTLGNKESKDDPPWRAIRLSVSRPALYGDPFWCHPL